MTAIDDRFTAALAERYRIERELGQGGMATVYLAQDLKHERQVAIKVLREDLSASLGAGRFVREIKLAAQLQHPHILPLLDSGEAGGFLYFVMPYVKGQSLRERLAREGELPVHEAVRLVAEVVDALVEAHAHGVVHRDIKPDNVMLSGRHALVTDFGVAKAISEATDLHTVTTLGVAVGTPTYMSPEQAAADPHVDHRSDIYSVGVMAYELLSGRPPFTGSTPQQVLAAHVTEAPDSVAKRRPAIPLALEALVMRCLAKRPADRFQTAAELHAALEPLVTSSSGITPTGTRPMPVATGTRRRGAAWAAGTLGVLAIIAAAVVFIPRLRPAVPCCNGLRDQLTSSGNADMPRLSPDGKQLAYREGSAIVVQDIPGNHPLVLDSTAAPLEMFWAADGLSLIYVGRSRGSKWGLFQVPRSGGAARRVGDPDGLIALNSARDTVARLEVASDTVTVSFAAVANGGRGDSLVLPWREARLGGFAWSPDSRWLAVIDFGTPPSGVAYVLSRRGVRTDSMAFKGLTFIHWNATSDALFLSQSKRGLTEQLISVPIDHRTGHFTRTIDTLVRDLNGNDPGFDASHSQHTLAYLSTAYTDSIWAVELQGTKATSHLLRASTAYQDLPAISPDGSTVAFIMDDQIGENYYAMPFDGGNPTALTADTNQHSMWQWFPDGRKGAAAVVRNDSTVIVTVDYPNGTMVPIRQSTMIESFVVTDSGMVWELGDGRFACVDRGSGSSTEASIAPDWYLVPVVRDHGNALLIDYGNGQTRLARLGPRCQFAPMTPVIPELVFGFTLLHWSGDTLIWAIPATGAVAESPHFVVWRTDGHRITRVVDLPARCSIAQYSTLTMSDDGRRLVCEQTSNKHDVVLLHDFKPPGH